MDVSPGFKQTEAGVIPEDWKVHALGSIGKFKNGLNKGGEAFGHGSPFVNLMDVFGVNSIAAMEHLGLVASTPFEQSEYDLRRGDVVFVRSSVKPSGVGLTAVIENDLPDTVYSGFLIRFRDNGSIALNFKKHCFYEEDFRKRIISASSASANTNVNQENLKALSIALPPTKAEQEAIAEALSDADALIKALEQLIAKKRQVKQGAMQELLTGKRRLPRFENDLGYKQTEVGMIPEDWKINSLGQLGAWKGGATPSMQNPAFWKNGTVSWISSGDVKHILMSDTPMKITDHAVKNSSTTLLPVDSIIIVTRSGILRKYLPVAKNTRPLAINQDIKSLIPESDYVADYLLHLLIWSGPRILATCLKSGTTVESIEFGWLKSFVVALPPIKAEQEAIASILNEMDEEVAALEEKLAKARQIKQGMMQELLTGRIRLL